VAPYGERPNNFNLDWRNGKVLSALTDSLSPGVMPQNTWSGNALQDLERAEEIAEKEYQIPKLIDAIDIHECPDELAMMTYISFFRDFWLDGFKKTCMRHTTFSKCEFTIQTKDKRGHNKTVGGDHFTVTSSDKGVHVQLTDNGNGTYAGSFPFAKGDVTFHVSVNNEVQQRY
jgi:hypothetical protein